MATYLHLLHPSHPSPAFTAETQHSPADGGCQLSLTAAYTVLACVSTNIFLHSSGKGLGRAHYLANCYNRPSCTRVHFLVYSGIFALSARLISAVQSMTALCFVSSLHIFLLTSGSLSCLQRNRTHFNNQMLYVNHKDMKTA